MGSLSAGRPTNSLGTVDFVTSSVVAEPATHGVGSCPVVSLSGGRPLLTVDHLERLMRRHGLDLAIAQALVLDEILEAVPLPADQERQVLADYLAAQGLTGDPGATEAWLAANRLDLADVRAIATHSSRLDRFKEQCFGDEVEIRFLERKGDLDQVVYSLIRVREEELAEELYQRIREGEADFADLAPRFSLGSERDTNGVVGPMSLSIGHPELESRLRVSRPGELLPPFFVKDIWVVLRLERLMPAQLDAECRKALLGELFESWFDERVRQVLAAEPLPGLPIHRLSGQGVCP